MKKRLVNIVFGCFLVCGSFLLSGCKSDSDNEGLNGNWIVSTGNYNAELTIDGKNALMSVDGLTEEGILNESKQKITFNDGDDKEVFTYKIVGDKLSLKSDSLSIALEREDSDNATKEKESSNSEVVIDSSETSTDATSGASSLTSIDESPSLDLGDYEVGTDINPGAYQVELYFRNSDYELTKGSGKVVVPSSGSAREYTFETDENGYSEDQRIILKEGDVITTSAKDGGNSDFHFSFDN